VEDRCVIDYIDRQRANFYGALPVFRSGKYRSAQKRSQNVLATPNMWLGGRGSHLRCLERPQQVRLLCVLTDHDHREALSPRSGRLPAGGDFRVVPANPRQQFEGYKRRVEFPEHDQSRRAHTGDRAGVTGCAHMLCWVPVRLKLLDQCSPQVSIGLDN
jgi:hypothetical protein